MKNLLWFQNLLRVYQNYTLTILLKFIERHMVFLHVMGSYLTMKVLEEGKLSLQEKLQCILQKKFWVQKIFCT